MSGESVNVVRERELVLQRPQKFLYDPGMRPTHSKERDETEHRIQERKNQGESTGSWRLGDAAKTARGGSSDNYCEEAEN